MQVQWGKNENPYYLIITFRSLKQSIENKPLVGCKDFLFQFV